MLFFAGPPQMVYTQRGNGFAKTSGIMFPATLLWRVLRYPAWRAGLNKINWYPALPLQARKKRFWLAANTSNEAERLTVARVQISMEFGYQ